MRKLAVCTFAMAAVTLAAALPVPAHAASTLEKIRAAGRLVCGLDTEEPEYTLADAHGNHALFDSDVCKAVAVAVLGKDAAVTIKPFRDEAGSLKALKAGDIDLLATGSPYMRFSNGAFTFARPIFYDTQGFLVNKGLGIHSVQDFAGKKVCFLIGTEIEAQINDYMSRQKVKYIPGPFSEEGEMEAALVTNNCAAITADVSQLGYERIAFKRMAKEFEILPAIVALDPLAPVTRSDDPQWSAIVDWTMQALIEAEENGVTQANVQEQKKTGTMTAQRLLGSQRGWGSFLGLDDDWATREVEAVGNYGEMFDRDLGAHSPSRLDRMLNRLASQGGLLTAEPVR